MTIQKDILRAIQSTEEELARQAKNYQSESLEVQEAVRDRVSNLTQVAYFLRLMDIALKLGYIDPLLPEKQQEELAPFRRYPEIKTEKLHD